MLNSAWLQNTLYISVLVFLLIEGIKRLRDGVFHLRTLAIAPIALLFVSIESLLFDLGMNAGHLFLFIGGLSMIIFFAFKYLPLSVLIVCPGSKRIVLAGSIFPLLLYIFIFGMKYSCASLLTLSITLSHNTILLGILALVYGSICGWFMGLFFLTSHKIYQASAIPLYRSEQ